jgi:hypothetical protein
MDWGTRNRSYRRGSTKLFIRKKIVLYYTAPFVITKIIGIKDNIQHKTLNTTRCRVNRALIKLVRNWQLLVYSLKSCFANIIVDHSVTCTETKK